MPDSSRDPRRPRGTAWDASLRYLGQRDHSEFEISQKLRQRGYTGDEVADVIKRLHSADLLDDVSYARQAASSLFENRGSSFREVRLRLEAKGVSQADIESALEQLEPADDMSRVRRLVARRSPQLMHLETEVRTRRLLSYLGRRGFPSGISYRAIKEWEEDLDNS